MTHFPSRLLIILLWCGALGACASKDALPNSARNQFVTEFFAYVNNVHEVEFDSHVEEGMATGAVIGAIDGIAGGRNPFAAAIISGGIFGLVTAIFEGDRTGYEYSLHAVDGDDVLVIVEQRSALQGECVLVRVAGEVSILPVDNTQCEMRAQL